MATLTTLAQSLAIISACWAIISGIYAWKREFIGKRQIELAEQTLAKFFEIKDAVAYIRNPFSLGGEGKSRQKGENESSSEAELLDRGFVVVERYTKKEAIFAEFSALKYRFMASFGRDTEKIFTDTFKTVNAIFSSARMLASHYWRRQGGQFRDGNDFDRHLTELSRHEGIFWDSGEPDDPVRAELNAIQRALETATAFCFREPAGSVAAAARRLGRLRRRSNRTDRSSS